jgi:DNA-binding transcriptional regulator LsrR (DeoR family)
MAPKKSVPKNDNEVADLLKKVLAVQLFELGVPQAVIAKRVKISINVVNDLVKGIKRNG